MKFKEKEKRYQKVSIIIFKGLARETLISRQPKIADWPRGLRSLGENCALELRPARAFCQQALGAQNPRLGANPDPNSCIWCKRLSQESQIGCKSRPKQLYLVQAAGPEHRLDVNTGPKNCTWYKQLSWPPPDTPRACYRF